MIALNASARAPSMRSEIRLPTVARLVDGIETAASPEELQEGSLRDIGRAFRSVSTCLWANIDTVGAPRALYTEVGLGSNYADEFMHDWCSVDPVYQALEGIRSDRRRGQVALSDVVPGRRQRLRSLFYNEICKPRGIDNYLCTDCGSISDKPIFLSLHRAPGSPEFSRQERDALKLIAPAIARAVERSGFGLLARAMPLLEQVLTDSTRCGGLVGSDSNGSALVLNGFARSLLGGEELRWIDYRANLESLGAVIRGSAANVAEEGVWTRCAIGVVGSHSFDDAVVRRVCLPQLDAILVALRPRPAQLTPEPGVLGLTGRLRDVAMLLADGYSYKRIANTLGISPNTARNHAARVYEVLGITSRFDLLRMMGRTRYQ
jgi:DNA-binding CsgD family transcriptional regulator